MPDSTPVSFLVPAAGCGARAGLGGNKILARLRGRPVLFWTLRALSHLESTPPTSTCSEIIVAARREEWPLIEPIFALFDASTRAKMRLVEGGETRQDSVRALALAAQGEIVAVHDAARPLLKPDLCARVIQAALEGGASMAAMPASDTVKIAVADGSGANVQSTVQSTLDRRLVWLAQTPQVFGRPILLEALAAAARDNFQGTDCASLVERLLGEDGLARFPVRLVEGSARNFKITFAHDLERAEHDLQVLEYLR